MATYLELRNLFNDAALMNRTQAGVVIAGWGVMNDPANYPSAVGPNTATEEQRVTWGVDALHRTETKVPLVLKAVLAQNKTATVDQIKNATDAVLQTNIDATVDALAKNPGV